MYHFKVVFYVNHRKTEQIVSAYTPHDAKKLIESQYAGAQITILSVTRV